VVIPTNGHSPSSSHFHPGVHVNQKRTDILHASIRLAWNIVFSEHGRKAAAQTLSGKWVSDGGGIIGPEELLAEAVWEVYGRLV
jgi:hypothetical protein